MDIAVDHSEPPKRGQEDWGVVTADWPSGGDADKLESWIEFVRQDRFRDCALSLSYRVPDDLLDLFIRR